MSQLAWFDSQLVSYEEADLDVAGWPIGSGTFETIKTVAGQPWALSRHMRRALNTARRNDLPFPSEELIRRAVSETIAANPFAIGRLRIHFGDSGSLFRVNEAIQPRSFSELAIGERNSRETLSIYRELATTNASPKCWVR